MSRVRVTGQENVPAKGPYLVAINHVSLFESAFHSGFLAGKPEAPGQRKSGSGRDRCFLARMYGGIQVHRGEYDRQLIDQMLSALRSGRPLVLAPEGGRSHSLGMRRGLPGMAYLVEQTGVPVIPVGIVGTYDEFFAEMLERQAPARGNAHRQAAVPSAGGRQRRR